MQTFFFFFTNTYANIYDVSDKTIAFRYNIYYDCTVEVAGKSSRVGRVEYVLVEGDAHGRVHAIFSVVSVYGKTEKTPRSCRRTRSVRIHRYGVEKANRFGYDDRTDYKFTRSSVETVTWGFIVYSRSDDDRVAKGNWKSSVSKELRETILLLNFRVLWRDASVSGEERFKTTVWPGRQFGKKAKRSTIEPKFVLKLFLVSSSKPLTVRCVLSASRAALWVCPLARRPSVVCTHARGELPKTRGRLKSTHYPRHRNNEQRFCRRHRYVVVTVSPSYFAKTSARAKVLCNPIFPCAKTFF